MIKDIVVNLSVGERSSPAEDYAISIAATFDARIAGIAFLYYPILAGAGYTVADLSGPKTPREMIETQQLHNAAAAKAAIDRFATASARARVSAEPLTPGANFAGAGEQFGRIARYFDLSVVGQAEPGTSGVEEQITEAALFDSGRPVIVVPYVQKAPLKLDSVMVCWDGSRVAARAIADAMPFLERAGRVEVVIVADERGKQDEIEAPIWASTLPAMDLPSRSSAFSPATSMSPTCSFRTPAMPKPISSSWAATATPGGVNSCSAASPAVFCAQ